MQTTSAAIRRALKRAGMGHLELVKGDGYFYVAGPDVERWPQTGIYVYRLSHMSVDQWVDAVAALKDAGERRIAESAAYWSK